MPRVQADRFIWQPEQDHWSYCLGDRDVNSRSILVIGAWCFNIERTFEEAPRSVREGWFRLPEFSVRLHQWGCRLQWKALRREQAHNRGADLEVSLRVSSTWEQDSGINPTGWHISTLPLGYRRCWCSLQDGCTFNRLLGRNDPPT